MTSYEIHFDSRTPAARIAEVLCHRYDLDPALVYVGDLADYSGPRLTAYVTPATTEVDGFACVFGAGETLAEAAGHVTELELTTVLCREAGTRAIIPDGGMAGSVWMLVTADGWHGRVVVDDDRLDDGDFVILHAYQPVPTEPDIPVVEPPEWQSGWYPDGKIPT